MVVIKMKFKTLKNNSGYNKFKKCSLPYPFWNKKHNTLEWVNYNSYDGFLINNELYESLTDRIYEFTYHYEIKSYSKKNIKKEIPNRVEVNHCHNFNDVLRALYEYPNSFSIPMRFKNEYSEQQLMFIKQLQNYFKLIQLKDYEESEELKKIYEKYDDIEKKKSILNSLKKHKLIRKEKRLKQKEWLKRTSNSKAFYYDDFIKMYIDNDEELNLILNNCFKIFKYNNYKKIENKYLVIDVQLNYRAAIKVVDERIMKLKDLEDIVDYKLLGYDNFLDYKKQLIKDFNYNNSEKISEDSLITYCTFDILEKF